MTNLHSLWKLGVFALMAFSLTMCTDDEVEAVFQSTTSFDSEVALSWNTVLLDLERYTPGYRPPVSARNISYIGIAAYESVANGMADEYSSIAPIYSGLSIPQISRGEEYHWPTVLNATYARIFAQFFPTAPFQYASKIQETETNFNNEFIGQVTQEVFNRSQEYGRSVADAVFAWSATDVAGHEAYLRPHPTDYVPPTGPGLWQPTYPDFTRALLPYWGTVRRFAISADEMRIKDPVAYSTHPDSNIYRQAREVHITVNQIKAGQRYEDRWVADFWSDDCAAKTFSPAGRWIAVANQVVDHENVDLGKAVYTYAKVGMAIGDAGIAAWHEKYRFNYQRPIDYIRQVFGDANWNSIMCPNGDEFYTPPFPAYPSGHATFGGAAAEVLTDIYGPAYGMTDYCHQGRTDFISTPRTFDNFNQMAEENAFSRIPIGVHFRMDSEQGLLLGYRAGRAVNRLPWKR